MRFLSAAFPLSQITLLASLFSTACLTLAAPPPRTSGVINPLSIIFDERRSIQRSDDTWDCGTLTFTANFLARSATVTAVEAPCDEQNLTVLAKVAEMYNSASLEYAVPFPVGQKFAFRLEDSNGAVAFSPVLKVAEPGYIFLKEPRCEKRDPGFYDQTRVVFQMLAFAGIVLLAGAPILGLFYLSFLAWESGEEWRGAAARQVRAKVADTDSPTTILLTDMHTAEEMELAIGGRMAEDEQAGPSSEDEEELGGGGMYDEELSCSESEDDPPAYEPRQADGRT